MFMLRLLRMQEFYWDTAYLAFQRVKLAEINVDAVSAYRVRWYSSCHGHMSQRVEGYVGLPISSSILARHGDLRGLGPIFR